MAFNLLPDTWKCELAWKGGSRYSSIFERCSKVGIEGEDADCLGALMAYFHTRPAKETRNKGHDMKLTDFEEQVLSMVEERVRAQEALSSGDEEE